MNVAARMSRLGTESAFEVLARAKALERQGKEIIHLEIGEPDFDTPANIREAAKRALDGGFTHYAAFSGIPALREAIAEDATARKRFAVTPDRDHGGRGPRRRVPTTSTALMPEVPPSGEHHREPVLIGGGDHLGVAYRTARLDDGGRAGGRDRFESIAKWKERV